MNPDSTRPSDDQAFRSWVAEKACVMHMTTGVVGIATAYHEPGEYVSPLNGEAVPAHVFCIGEHSFVADDAERFMKLSPALADTFISFSEALGQLLKLAMTGAAQRNVEPEQAVKIFASVLREQVTRLA